MALPPFLPLGNTNTVNVVQRLISAVRRDRGLKKDAEVAEFFGVDAGSLSRMKRGEQMPSHDVLVRMLERAGGNLERAFPWYRPDAGGEQGKVVEMEEEWARARLRTPLLGWVDAGSGQPVFGDVTEPLESYANLDALGERSGCWRAGVGAAFVLRIGGDSMWPEYREGDRVLLRRVRHAQELRDGWPPVHAGSSRTAVGCRQC